MRYDPRRRRTSPDRPDPAEGPAMPRRRWLKRTLFSALVLVILPAVAFLGVREYYFSANERELAEAVAETDGLDPAWRWDDLQAARAPLPERDNALSQLREVSRLLGGRVPSVPHGGGTGPAWADVMGSVPPNRLLTAADREALGRWLVANDAAVRAARDL